jgi:hypothetical protein
VSEVKMLTTHRAFSVALLGCLSTVLSIGQEVHYPAGKIRGTVWNDRGEPVEGARVEATPFGKILAMILPWAETDKDGHFVIEHLQLQEYTVSARKEDAGYADMAWEFYSEGTPRPKLTLTAAVPEVETTIVLGPKAGVLTGKIVDAATGSPVPAVIKMWRLDGSNPWLAPRVPPEYRVLIPANVPVGLSFHEDGYEDWRLDGPLRVVPGGSTILNVALHGIWPLVDLVAKPARPGKERAVTRLAVPPSQNPPLAPKLPLEISLEAVTLGQESPWVMIAQVHIKNIGTEPYRLPVGRDGETALKSINRGRHEFWFSLKPLLEEQVLSGEPTFASTDLPDSFLTIQPGAMVRVRFAVDIGARITAWQRRGVTVAPLQAICVDLFYEDNPKGYFVQQPQPEAVSRNELGVPLKY